MKCKRLEINEWKFDNVPDKGAMGIFLYEYLRHSVKFRDLIYRLRAMDNPAMFGHWPDRYMPMTVKRRELLRKELGNGETFAKLVEALMNCSKFPKTPGMKLRDQNWIQDLSRVPGLRICSGEIIDIQDRANARNQILGKPGIEYHFKGNLQTQEFESVFALLIDWRKPDKVIANDFRNKVLNFRPACFQHLDNISPEQAAFGNLSGKLPFKPITALNWLGVLRGFENAGSDWGKYCDFYGGFMRKHLPGFESWRRKRKRDCQRARTILVWLEGGAKGKLSRQHFR